MAVSVAINISFSKKKKLQNSPMLKIDSAASSGGQGKLTYFVYFPWPSREKAVVSHFHVASNHLISERNYPTSNIVCTVFNVY